MGIGDWGLGIGDWGLGPIPNPQSPILRKLDSNFNELDYKHIMSKKKLLSSKNAKKMCRNGIPIKYMKNILLKMFNINFFQRKF